MSDNSKNIVEDKEIDLSMISKAIGNFFENLSTRIFRGILFVKRNLLIIGTLILLGLGLGFYLDVTEKVYDHKLIVRPNFNSTEYLYTKIDLIESKIEDNDLLFLSKVVGIKEPEKLLKIQIKPIIDIYKLIDINKDKDGRSINLEIVKMLAENNDLNKVLTEGPTSKNYRFHNITFTTASQTSNEKTIQPILNYLNDSKYYSVMQQANLNNLRIKMAQNDSTIAQINSFLNNFSGSVNGSQKADKLVYYNENSPLNDIIKTKGTLINDQGVLRLDFEDSQKIVKDCTVTMNVKNVKSVNGNLEWILPLLFVLLFILGGAFRAFYRRQMAKLNQ